MAAALGRQLQNFPVTLAQVIANKATAEQGLVPLETATSRG